MKPSNEGKEVTRKGVNVMDQSPEFKAGYETGYANGESSSSADWHFALNEHGGFPDGFDFSPTAVAAEVTKLRDQIEKLRGALADIALSDDDDMPLETVKRKALRIYEEVPSPYADEEAPK